MKLFRYLNLKDPILVGASILAVGPALGYLIGFVLFVFLIRVYSAEQFGYYSTYLSLTMIFSTIISGKYDAAIIVSKTQEEFIDMVKLALVCTVTFSVFFVVVVFLIKAFVYFGVFSINKNIDQLLVFIPFSALFVGVYNILNSIALRNKAYKGISISEFQLKIGQVLFQLLLGILYQTIYGLVAGFILSIVVSILIIIKPILKQEFSMLKNYDLKHLFAIAKDNYTYPVLIGSGQLTNILTQHLPTLFICAIYSAKEAALYVVISKIFTTINHLIGQTTNKVYFANVSAKFFYEPGTHQYLRDSFINIVIKFFVIITPVFLIIGLLGTTILGLLFDDTWRGTEMYVSALTALYFFQLMSMPFGLFVIAMNKKKLFFYRELIWLILIVSLFTTTWQAKLDINTSIYYYSVVGSCYYLMYILSSWHVINCTKKDLLETEASV